MVDKNAQMEIVPHHLNVRALVVYKLRLPHDLLQTQAAIRKNDYQGLV